MTSTPHEVKRLTDACDEALAVLASLPTGLQTLGETHYMMHDEFVDRVQSLGRYLEWGLGAIRQDAHAPGFALIRSALEHHLVDYLYMRARRYVVKGQVDLATFQRWERDHAAGAEGTEETVELSRNDGGAFRIIRQGAIVRDDGGRELYRTSAYFTYLERFDPLLGPPDDQRFLEVAWNHLPALEARAREQQRLYGETLSWKGICSNLAANGFYSEQDRLRLNVHYRFLSAFVHPTPAADRMVHRRANAVVWGDADHEHAIQELGHLYVAAIASRELAAFAEMADTHPSIGISDRPRLDRAAAEARRVSQHLWFPGDGPHTYDLWRRRVWSQIQESEGHVTAAEVGVNEPYYRDPLDRLLTMHYREANMAGSYEPVFFEPTAAMRPDADTP